MADVQQQQQEPVEASGGGGGGHKHAYHESREIQGVPTDLVIMSFADRIVVTLSQSGKFGTLISARSEAGSGGAASGAEGGNTTFDVNVLLGRRDDPLLVIYARQMIEAISKSSSRPLLLSIALKERDPETFQEIMAWVTPLL